jgi:GABA(A) receptor-associated protein
VSMDLLENKLKDKFFSKLKKIKNKVINKKNIKTFKEQHTFEECRAESDRILLKYPDRVPVIVEKNQGSDLPEIDRKKFLVPADLSFGQMIYVIRKRIRLPPDMAIFLFINNCLVPASALMSQIYKEQCDPNGFLFITFSDESTFGFIL